MDDIKVKLPASLRKYIRTKKAEIRREHGVQSPQMREFLEWVEEKRKEKHAKVIAGRSRPSRVTSGRRSSSRANRRGKELITGNNTKH